MGEIRGYVTRNSGGRTIGLMGIDSSTNALSRNAFSATRANGDEVGTFDSVRSAQQRVEKTVGFGLLLWRRIDLKTGIEHYEGRDAGFYPGDLNQLVNPQFTRVAVGKDPVGLLVGGAWYRADQGITSGAALSVSRWSSHDGSPDDHSAAVGVGAPQPGLAEVAAAGRPAVRFSAGTSEQMGIPGLAALTDSFVVVAGVTYEPAGREQVIVNNGAGGFSMGVTIAGDWFVDSAAGRITGGAAVPGQFTALSAIFKPAGVGAATAYVNGASFGTNVGSAVAGTWELSDTASGWHQDMSEVIVLPNSNLQAHTKLVRYVLRRYIPA